MQYRHHNGPDPCHPAGESGKPHLRVDFDRRLKLEFHGTKITSDAGRSTFAERPLSRTRMHLDVGSGTPRGPTQAAKPG